MQKLHNIEIGGATLHDVEQIEKLLEKEVEKGVILYRSTDEIAQNIRSYIVAKIEREIVGVVSLYIYSKTLSEFRSLFVSENIRKGGIGRKLIQHGVEIGTNLGLKEFLVLTYKKDLFLKLGFYEIEKSEIPNGKIWADCIKCQYFPICDEVALVLKV